MMVVVHGSRITCHCDARFKERALVGLILDGDSRWNRLQALKARGRFEIGTLLTAVQSGAALGTLAFPIHAGRQSGRTAKTASRDDVLQKPREAGSGDVNGGT